MSYVQRRACITLSYMCQQQFLCQMGSRTLTCSGCMYTAKSYMRTLSADPKPPKPKSRLPVVTRSWQAFPFVIEAVQSWHGKVPAAAARVTLRDLTRPHLLASSLQQKTESAAGGTLVSAAAANAAELLSCMHAALLVLGLSVRGGFEQLSRTDRGNRVRTTLPAACRSFQEAPQTTSCSGCPPAKTFEVSDRTEPAARLEVGRLTGHAITMAHAAPPSNRHESMPSVQQYRWSCKG